MSKAKEKVLVAMSGGVDSSVTAFLLKEAGYEVEAVHVILWKPEHNGSSSEENMTYLEKTAEILDIRLHILDMKNFFYEKVVKHFINSYSEGLTPNPCIICNRLVKFGEILKFAESIGIDKIATGHYARISKNPDNGRYCVASSADRTKNQSYFLYTLSQKALRRTVFPLGDLTKTEVRSIAVKNHLPSAARSESQEVCFIPDDNYRSFLKNEGLSFTPGYIKDSKGNIIGSHSGRENFTIGQRKGLGIAWSEPLYVIRLDKDGTVTAGTREETYSDTFMINSFNYQELDPSVKETECFVQIRYRSQPVPCILELSHEGSGTVRTVQKVSGVTPGQSAVFYRKKNDDYFILGGGIIVKNLY